MTADGDPLGQIGQTRAARTPCDHREHMAVLEDLRATIRDEQRRHLADVRAAQAHYADELAQIEGGPADDEGYDPRRHRCPLCCPTPGHTTVEVPYWLGDSDLMPAHWRFVYHVIGDHTPGDDARQARLDSARLYAQVYGRRALARAIREARTVPVPHPHQWDPVWDGLLGKLHDPGFAL